MMSNDQMQRGLFTDRVKILLYRPPEFNNKIFITPIIRAKENTNSRKLVVLLSRNYLSL